jgi:hypothetical protein
LCGAFAATGDEAYIEELAIVAGLCVVRFDYLIAGGDIATLMRISPAELRAVIAANNNAGSVGGGGAGVNGGGVTLESGESDESMLACLMLGQHAVITLLNLAKMHRCVADVCSRMSNGNTAAYAMRATPATTERYGRVDAHLGDDYDDDGDDDDDDDDGDGDKRRQRVTANDAVRGTHRVADVAAAQLALRAMEPWLTAAQMNAHIRRFT